MILISLIVVKSPITPHSLLSISIVYQILLFSLQSMVYLKIIMNQFQSDFFLSCFTWGGGGAESPGTMTSWHIHKTTFFQDFLKWQLKQTNCVSLIYRVRNLKFARNLKFTTSKTLVNFMKKIMFLSKKWYFSVQKALIYYTVNKSHHNSFILLVFSHVANFRYVANFRFLTLIWYYSVFRSSCSYII